MVKSRRRLLKIVVGVICLYLALCLIMFSIQDWMIFPGTRTQGTSDAIVRPSTDYELLNLQTADGDPFVALFGVAIDGLDKPVADSGSRPTILFFYGNDMSLSGCFGMFREFRRLGANMMMVEYPGYGMSGGKASERSLYAAADAAFDNLSHRTSIDGGKIIAMGWSLGAAVATDLAANRPVAGLATFSAFTSMTDMARLRAFLLPTSLLLRSRFDNEAKIGRITCPIFNAHGTHDSIVPFAMSKRLIAAAKSPVTSVEVDSDHNDIFEMGGEALSKQLGGFLEDLAK